MIYFIVASLSVALAMVVNQRQKQQVQTCAKRGFWDGNRLLMWAAGVPPFLIAALRYGIGTDYFYTYIPQYQYILRGYRGHYEIGFYLLNKFLTFFTDNAQWLIAITSFITIFFIYDTIYKVSKNVFTSTILFFLTYTFFISINNLRQTLATAIVIFGLRYLKKKQYVRFIICILIAFTIHRIAFLYFLLLFIRKIRISEVGSLIFLAVVFALREFVSNKLDWIFDTIPYISYFKSYLTSGMYAGRTLSYVYVLVNVIFLILFFCIERYGGADRDDPEAVASLNFAKTVQLLVVAICLLDGFVPADYRLVRVFSLFQFLTIPNVLEQVRRKEDRNILYILVFLCFTVLFAQNYVSGAEEVFPYQSIFSAEAN